MLNGCLSMWEIVIQNGRVRRAQHKGSDDEAELSRAGLCACQYR